MTNEMRIMNATGDLKINWDPAKSDEVSAARDQFDKMKKKGYLAYTVDKKGDKGEVMREFDGNAGLIILAPPMRGG